MKRIEIILVAMFICGIGAVIVMRSSSHKTTSFAWPTSEVVNDKLSVGSNDAMKCYVSKTNGDVVSFPARKGTCWVSDIP